MKKFRHLLSVLFLLVFCISANAQDPDWKIIQSEYPSDDIGVMTYNIKDFGAAGDGIQNDAPYFQTALAKLGQEGGGVLYVPSGKYKFNGFLTIPKGVVMRGEWKKPVKGEPIEGTILMPPETVGRGMGITSEGFAFITMEPSTMLTDVAIWYPTQDPDKIVPYPPAVLYGKSGVWGNDYCNVRNVTLVNAYNGVCVSRTNGGGCPNIYGLYGTPLSVGVEIDNIADVGRFDWIDFSPEYWAGSGLPGSPDSGSSYKNWIYENGTGFVMRRNDWSYTCYLNVEGYNKGFSASPSMSRDSPGSAPNGHNYGMTFTDCKTAVYVESVADAGIMFTRINTKNCENGVVVEDGTGGIIQLYEWDIDASANAVLIKEDAATKVLLQDCKINSGKVVAGGGTLMSNNGDFNNPKPQITIGGNARSILTGNRFAQEEEIINNSMFECVIDNSPVTVPALPDFPEFKVKETKPAKSDLFVVTAPPYNAVPDEVTDNTAAIQKALDAAGLNGGGIVFLPPGKYKVSGNLAVPTGVELKGASDLATVPRAQGSILEVYAGKGDPTAEPFIKLAERSGIRGISFNYPEQTDDLYPDWPEYPYCIQGTGSDIYIVNIGLRAVFHGVDLFTYKCDNHYVDYLAGHVFTTGIRVGGGSENGIICNTQFNTIVYASGRESKFGSWPNSPDNTSQPDKDKCYQYNWDFLNFMILGDCKNEILYNDFHFGSQRGIVFGDENGSPSGIALGLGIDASRRAVYFSSLAPEGFDLINSQIVSTTPDGNDNIDTKYIESEPDFAGKSTFFSSDYWGSPNHAITAAGGDLNFIMANLRAPGRLKTMNLTGTSIINMLNSYLGPKDPLSNSGAEEKLSVESSLADASGIDQSKCNVWKNNLSNTAIINPDGLLDRTGWRASASVNNSSANNPLDNDIDSRWSSGGSQAPGQWFAVDLRSKLKFNRIILDSSPSPNDAPIGYSVTVSDDGLIWSQPIKTGGANGAISIISFPEVEAQYVRITQTGTKTNYWSIHEFYLFLAEEESEDMHPFYQENNTNSIFIANGILYFAGTDADKRMRVDVYNLSGQLVFSSPSVISGTDVSSLNNGIYIVELKQNDKVYRQKVRK